MYYAGWLMICFARTQSRVSLSSCEAEIVAVSTVTQEVMYLQSVLKELFAKDVSVEVRCDSTSARALIARRGPGRLKHISIRFLWLQDAVREGLKVSGVSSVKNVADVFTKVVSKPRLLELCSMIGLGDACTDADAGS